MDVPAETPSVLRIPAANLISAKDVIDRMCRRIGIDPEALPNADDLPPWTDAEADAFKRSMDESCERIDEF